MTAVPVRPRNQQPNAVQFRSLEIERNLAERGWGDSLGQVAKRDLGRYYALLAAELRRLDLTETEASLCCDALNGVLVDEASLPLVWAEVDDAIRLSGLAEKWGVDGPALVTRLRAPGAGAAVADASERFWRDPNPIGDALRRVGLVR